MLLNVPPKKHFWRKGLLGLFIEFTFRKTWTNHTFFISGRFFFFFWVRAYLVDGIWHKNKSDDGKMSDDGKSVTIYSATAYFMPKKHHNSPCHNFVFYSTELIVFHYLCFPQEHFRGKTFVKFQVQVAFLTFSSVFTRFSPANRTLNYPH